ncbi:MAG: Uma2 family endonuclease [Desulfobacterales bacterium]|nr:Uma2 family endonuclease [Desulfobacterales bacterium]MBF0395906.1 Uma2 family endonuclease [Desulfobacterales bacterium]
MLAEQIHIMTEEEYLEMERRSEIKHEYHQGELFSMAGASGNHNLIVANIIRDLGIQLKRRCKVYPSDIKIKIKNTGRFVYPDVTVVCGKEKYFDNAKDVLLDADLIVEVLSDSTELYERSDKFAYYRKLDSFKEYLLVSQKKKKIEKFLKNESGFWKISEAGENDPEIIIESLGCALNIEDIYDFVVFENLKE